MSVDAELAAAIRALGADLILARRPFEQPPDVPVIDLDDKSDG